MMRPLRVIVPVSLIVSSVMLFSGCRPFALTSDETSPMTPVTSAEMILPNVTPTPVVGVPISDTVFTPDHSWLENAINAQDHTGFVSLITSAGLWDAFASSQDVTVLLPINSAVSAIPGKLAKTFSKPPGHKVLVDLVNSQIIPGKFLLKELPSGQVLTTRSGRKLVLTKTADAITLRDSLGRTLKVLNIDVPTQNGMVDVVDKMANLQTATR